MRLSNVSRRLGVTIAAFAIAGGAATVVSTALAQGAQAAAIPSAITGISLSMPDGSPLNPDGISNTASIRVTAQWSIPDGAAAGDTFSLRLPTQFAGSSMTFSLKTPDQSTAGTCAVADLEVLCTLSAYVDTHNDVHGNLWFTSSLDVDVTGTGVPVVIDFDIVGVDPITVIVDGPTPLTPSEAHKYGGWREGVTAWEIFLPDSINSLPTASILDTPGPGQKCTSEGLPRVSLEGYISSGHAESLGSIAVIQNGDGTFTIPLPSPLASQFPGYPQYAVYYECDITDAKILTYTNKATIFGNDSPITDVTSSTDASSGGGDGTGETPTPIPTDDPSDSPSATPTVDPSDSPSATPTADPSDSPSASPSADPSDSPSATPTSDPSDSPSATPTADPSDAPSTTPTEDPTDAPSTAGLAPSSSATATGTPIPTLASTGSSSGTVTGAGMLAIFGGLAVLVLARRTKRSDS